jgi:hypothetical protein
MTLSKKTRRLSSECAMDIVEPGPHPGSGSYITDTRPKPRNCGYVRRLSRSKLNALQSEEKR